MGSGRLQKGAAHSGDKTQTDRRKQTRDTGAEKHKTYKVDAAIILTNVKLHQP